MKNWMILSLVIFSFAACKKDVDQVLVDQEKIESYLTDNQLTAQVHPSGLHYILDEPLGTGDHPTTSDKVTVKYKGYLLDGTVFDQTQGDKTISFSLTNLIEGWKIGIPLLKEGGKGTFLLPSALGYGNFPPPRSVISANEVLLFDIELISID
jgi:FKBP-type peptidyl-prolyl cis-trans isomerase